MSVAVQRAAQPARFLAVGAVGYGVNLLTFALLVAAEVEYVLASVVSYLVSNMLMYIGNRYFTFRLGNDGFWTAYARYLVVGLVVVTLNAGVLALLVEVVGLGATLGQALSLLIVTPVAFVLFKRWTFRLTS
jgi:putative flippase GtrA